MNVDFINTFLTAVTNVLETMAFLKPVAGKPYLKKDHIAKGDITGIIGMTGNSRGSVALSFSSSCAIKIVSNMLGEEISELSEDVRDAVGEITNMISGNARQELSKLGYEFSAGIPTVIIGKNHSFEHICKAPCIVIPFSTGNGDFVLEASFED